MFVALFLNNIHHVVGQKKVKMSKRIFSLPTQWPKTLQSWIGGKFVGNTSKETRPLFHAATGKAICDWEVAGVSEVNMAVDMATKAQQEWKRKTPVERGRVLRKAAEILTAKNNELSELEAYDTSRPIQETDFVDIVSARDSFEYYGGMATAMGGEYIQQPNQSFALAVRYASLIYNIYNIYVLLYVLLIVVNCSNLNIISPV